MRTPDPTRIREEAAEKVEELERELSATFVRLLTADHPLEIHELTRHMEALAVRRRLHLRIAIEAAHRELPTAFLLGPEGELEPIERPRGGG